jgi:hypothetical protein
MAEATTFLALFPTAENTCDNKRERKKLGKGAYLNARLFSADLRCAQNTKYIFYAQCVPELERILFGISISMRKGAKTYHGTPITASMLSDKDTLYRMLKVDEGFRYT